MVLKYFLYSYYATVSERFSDEVIVCQYLPLFMSKQIDFISEIYNLIGFNRKNGSFWEVSGEKSKRNGISKIQNIANARY